MIIIRKYFVNENFFKQITPESAYVLGWIASDGFIRSDLNNFSIASTDIDILQSINNLMGSNCKIRVCLPPKGKNSFKGKKHIGILTICRKSMVQDLISLGIVPRKSKILQMPKVDDENFRHFLRGYFEGDGYASISRYPTYIGYQIGFTCGSLLFLKQLQKKLRKELKIRGKIYKEVYMGNTSYRLRYLKHDEVKKLFKYMYDNVPQSMILKRKFDVLNQIFNERGEQNACSIV